MGQKTAFAACRSATLAHWREVWHLSGAPLRGASSGQGLAAQLLGSDTSVNANLNACGASGHTYHRLRFRSLSNYMHRISGILTALLRVEDMNHMSHIGVCLPQACTN